MQRMKKFTWTGNQWSTNESDEYKKVNRYTLQSTRNTWSYSLPCWNWIHSVHSPHLSARTLEWVAHEHYRSRTLWCMYFHDSQNHFHHDTIWDVDVRNMADPLHHHWHFLLLSRCHAAFLLLLHLHMAVCQTLYWLDIGAFFPFPRACVLFPLFFLFLFALVLPFLFSSYQLSLLLRFVFQFCSLIPFPSYPSLSTSPHVH